jgi:sugar phosphate isomerase/epimerase
LSKNHHDQAIRLGIRAHDLGRFRADELARRVSTAGFECVQLALSKALEGVELAGDGPMDPAMVQDVATAFARHGVGIEVLGCYINPIHPEPSVRRNLYDLFKEHLRHARDFGCNIVALESGSMNGDYSFHPGNHGEDAFIGLVTGMRELVDEAQRCGVVVGIEAVTSHVVSTPEKMRRLLDEIASPHLKVVFDPVNLLNAANHASQRDVVHRALDLFGDEIVVVHAKDFLCGGDGGFVTCPAGTGMLDYNSFLRWFVRHKPGIPVLLEEAGVSHATAAREFLLKQLCTPIQ